MDIITLTEVEMLAILIGGIAGLNLVGALEWPAA
jgi:hypothetical protein